MFTVQLGRLKEMRMFKIINPLPDDKRPGICSLYAGLVTFAATTNLHPPHCDDCKCYLVETKEFKIENED